MKNMKHGIIIQTGKKTLYNIYINSLKCSDLLDAGYLYWLPPELTNEYNIMGCGKIPIIYGNGSSHAGGIRVVVTLKPEMLLNRESGVGTSEHPYGINEKLKVSYSPTEQTTGNVTITVTTETDFTIKYQTEEGTWEEYQSEGILVDKNREVNIKLVDENDVTIGTKSVTINNIEQA